MDLKTAAMREWRERIGSAERACEMTLVVEAAIERDLSDRGIRLLELTARHEEAHAQEVIARGHAKEALELALELTHGNVRTRREMGDGDRFSIVLEHKFTGCSQSVILAWRRACSGERPQDACEPAHLAGSVSHR